MAHESHSGSGSVKATAAILSLRVIYFSLVMGLVAFAVVVEVVLGRKATSSGVPQDVLLWTGAGLLVLGVLMSMVLPGLMQSSAIKAWGGAPIEGTPPELVSAYMVSCVLRGALLEGPALFGVVVVLLTGNPLGYIATGVGLLLMLATIPSRGGLERLVERASGRVTLER